MTSRLLVAALAGACLLAALAPPALAGPSFQLAANAKSVDGLVDPGGTLHAVWADDAGVATNVVHYCRVPRGATACANARTLLLPQATDHTDEPYLVRGSGATLHVAMARSAEEDAFVWTSADNGATWGAARKVYDGHPCSNESEPVLGPVGGEITFAGWNAGHCVHGAAIDGSESAESLVADPPSGGAENFAVAPTGDGGLIAASDDQSHTFFWRLQPGSDPSSTAAWHGVSDLGAGREANVAGGPGGAYVLNQDADQIHMRHWEGAGFGVLVDVGAGERGSVHDVTVGPSAEVAAVWRRSPANGEPFGRLRIARSRNQGASFSAPVSFATTASAASRLDADLAADGSGFAVWQDEGRTVRAASLDPIAEFAPPAAPGPTPAPAPAPGPGPAPPKPPATHAVTRTVAVKGAKVTLTGPRGCVRTGGTFVATLKWTRQKRKGNLFVKVRRADFYIGTRRAKIDRKAPFRRPCGCGRPPPAAPASGCALAPSSRSSTGAAPRRACSRRSGSAPEGLLKK
jgi:hypothetical protein